MQKLPKELLSLIAHLKKLPGVGTRTAERFAFELLAWPKKDTEIFAETLKNIQDNLPPCPGCGCLAEKNCCPFCTDPKRNKELLCLISSPKDAFAIEATHSYQGLYHVVENLLSPIDGRNASSLRIDRIEERIKKQGVTEIIIALDSTLEGDATALYLKTCLSNAAFKISRLAFGLPVGSSLEYIDGGTLTRAMAGRQSF